MTARYVCAVVVTYLPNAGMIEYLSKIHAEVQGLVVVDNGSNAKELNLLRRSSQTLGFHLIENERNLGIAEALNQGIRWAQGETFPWVALFDQDSKITDGFIAEMFAAWETHPHRERVGSIHPRYVDPESGFEPAVRQAGDSGPVTSMTSGALMPMWIFDKIGWFEADYFIDWVDFEYSFRIRAAGYSIAQSKGAVLLHTAGSPRKMFFLGFSFRPSHHSATRQYYISRNRIVVFRKYFPTFPGWVSQSLLASFRETIKSVLVEDDRGRKFRNFLLGTWDGLTGRMGRREGLERL
jgi:rhamnosyltransferase